MRHINDVLRPATIDNAKAKDRRCGLTDGGGLVLEVMPSGSKTWCLLRSKWPEFDLDAAQWDIPAERMKTGKPHRVFLSCQSVEILRHVHVLTRRSEKNAAEAACSHMELA